MKNEQMKVNVFPPPLSSPSMLILEVMHWGGSITKWEMSGSLSHWMREHPCQTEVNFTWMSYKFLSCRDTKLSKNICYCRITYPILIKATVGHLTEIASSICIDLGRSLETLLIKEKVSCQTIATEWNILCWNKIMKVGYSFHICRNVCIKA